MAGVMPVNGTFSRRLQGGAHLTRNRPDVDVDEPPGRGPLDERAPEVGGRSALGIRR